MGRMASRLNEFTVLEPERPWLNGQSVCFSSKQPGFKPSMLQIKLSPHVTLKQTKHHQKIPRLAPSMSESKVSQGFGGGIAEVALALLRFDSQHSKKFCHSLVSGQSGQ